MQMGDPGGDPERAILRAAAAFATFLPPISVAQPEAAYLSVAGSSAPMPVTIELIAQRAGVSPSTVARVLRGDVKGAQARSARKVSEIRRISEELGYRPNWRAR